jgi:hypothetical protein
MFKLRKYLFAGLLFLVSSGLSAQASETVFDENGIAREMVLDEQIRTIQLYREGWINSYPIMTIQEQVPLVLEFDELSDNISALSYMVFHCDADWRRSELTEQEYMEGYFENRIDDVEGSFNTYTSYQHYRLQLPNDDIRFTESGNYLLVVYRDYDPGQVVFTRRFMVSEAVVTIQADVHRPVLTMYRDNSHEVDVTVSHPGLRIDDPFRETTLSIYQNGIWNYGITGLQPLFVNPGELVYDYQEENVFPAGNEFRMFNTRNTQVREYHIAAIDYLDYFHFHLKKDEPNPPHLYFDRDDLNGKFFIEAANVREPSVEADYVFVHFTLDMPFPLAGGDVYIAGATTNWQFTGMNRMEYDPDVSAYRATLFLKQGNHNYRYVFVPDDRNVVDIAEIEGSHYQTNNEYLVLFYHRGQGDRYDRLVGHQVVHSNVN